MVHIVVIGAGIVGMATAKAILEQGPGLSVCVVEAEGRVAVHQTGNNSGVIHSGLYYKPGSLKAKNCVEGRKALYRFCQEQGIAHEQCGKVVVAVDESQLPALASLEVRGRANGLEGLRRLSGEELRKIEPAARGVAGLLVPETGIVDYVAVTNAYLRIVQERGGTILTRARVRGFRREGGKIRLDTAQGPVLCEFLVNCAGLHSDRVARLCGLRPKVKIIPFRGEYYHLDPARSSLVKNLIYPVPDPKFPFLGVHFTRMIRGGVEAGPNAVLAFKREGYSRFDISLRDLADYMFYPGFWRMAVRFWPTGMAEMRRSFSKAAFVRSLQTLVPEIRSHDVRRGGAGVRAQALDASGTLVDDFRIERGEGMIHVLNAPSPAATASLSIGETVARMAIKGFGAR